MVVIDQSLIREAENETHVRMGRLYETSLK